MHYPPEAALIHANIEGNSYRTAGRSISRRIDLIGGHRTSYYFGIYSARVDMAQTPGILLNITTHWKQSPNDVYKERLR